MHDFVLFYVLKIAMHSRLLITIVIAALSLSVQAQSFLSKGKWAAIETGSSGMYKITMAELKNMGLDVASSDPRNFQIYGTQGQGLPETNTALVRAQSHQIPCDVIGEADGVWNDGDAVIFYVQSTKDWAFSQYNYQHFSNFYADKTQFVIGHSDTKGMRIENQKAAIGAIGNTVKGIEQYDFHDSDMVNPNSMGRMWFGERLGNETLVRSFQRGISTGVDSIELDFQIASFVTDDTGSLVVTANGKVVRYRLRSIGGSYEPYYLLNATMKVPVQGSNLNLQFKLNRPNTKSYVLLDYFEVKTWQSAQHKPSATAIIRNQELASSNQNLFFQWSSQDTQVNVWNVSNPLMPKLCNIEQLGGGDLRILLSKDEPHHTFISFPKNNAKFLQVQVRTLLDAQNKAFDNSAELIILTHPDFIPAANQLANYRKINPGYTVAVITPQQIYNEFSGGQQDLVALRDYFRWRRLYAQQNGSKFRFVTILGAASYDMKNRVVDNTNFVPVYQSTGNAGAGSFCLDDFLGFLDSNEGDPMKTKGKLAISIGRIPVRTLAEATGVIAKLERYGSPKSLGPWRANIAFACDDVDESWETEFVTESEYNSNYINQFFPYFNVNKLYTDAFSQSTTGNNEKYPEMSAAINRTMKDGALFFNYQGHGGIKGWAQESILDIPMVNSWENSYKMPILFTATCEFSAFDDPKNQSAGELTLLNPRGGAIALMSTTRLVYVSGNTQINRDFWTNYGFPKPNEPIPTLGEVFQRMKNRPTYNSEDNKFALLGDASMPIAFPKHLIQVDSVQGKHVSAFRDTVKAFSVIHLKGHINERLVGEFTGFNGTMWVKIFDKPIQKYTLNNDGQGNPVAFSEQSGVLFNGQVTVKNGKFELVFSVPKDIAYNYGIGLAKFYAHNNVTDAAGSWQFFIGGSEQVSQIDVDGPQVKAFMQDTTFSNGGKVARDVDFVARIFDKDGINSTGAGIGRDLQLIIDEGTEKQQNFVLNDYFSYDVNSYTRGTVRFPLSDLIPGKHTFTCKAWDIYNNPGKGMVQCLVIPPRTLEVTGSGAFPQPFYDELNVWVQHSLPGENLTVKWKVMDASGRVLADGQQWQESAQAKMTVIDWDGKSSSGADLQGGVYFYQVLLLTEDGLEAKVGGKFVKAQ
jgi:hypothetical protein